MLRHLLLVLLKLHQRHPWPRLVQSARLPQLGDCRPLPLLEHSARCRSINAKAQPLAPRHRRIKPVCVERACRSSRCSGCCGLGVPGTCAIDRSCHVRWARAQVCCCFRGCSYSTRRSRRGSLRKSTPSGVLAHLETLLALTRECRKLPEPCRMRLRSGVRRVAATLGRHAKLPRSCVARQLESRGHGVRFNCNPR
jgi:hypothetical protein